MFEVSGHADLTVLIWLKSNMSMEHMDNDENVARSSLGMVAQSVDRRSGSVSPENLPHAKPEGIKSSSTEPWLSSTHDEPSRNRNVRYAVLELQNCSYNLFTER